MKKKILVLCLVIALAATAVIGGTLAYFTDTDSKDNVFTVGNVDIELSEPNWVDGPKVYPGQILDKNPIVTNKGANPCYVRIKVTGLDCLGENLPITLIGLNSTHWTLIDGYYYYNFELPVGTSTPALFTQIRIPTALENPEEALDENPDENVTNSFKVEVYAEAIQSEGKPEAYTIPNWFEACGMNATTDPIFE